MQVWQAEHLALPCVKNMKHSKPWHLSPFGLWHIQHDASQDSNPVCITMSNAVCRFGQLYDSTLHWQNGNKLCNMPPTTSLKALSITAVANIVLVIDLCNCHQKLLHIMMINEARDVGTLIATTTIAKDTVKFMPVVLWLWTRWELLHPLVQLHTSTVIERSSKWSRTSGSHWTVAGGRLAAQPCAHRRWGWTCLWAACWRSEPQWLCSQEEEQPQAGWPPLAQLHGPWETA